MTNPYTEAIARTKFCPDCTEALRAYRITPEDITSEGMLFLRFVTVVCPTCAGNVLALRQEWVVPHKKGRKS